MKIVLSTSEFLAAVQIALSAKKVVRQIGEDNVRVVMSTVDDAPRTLRPNDISVVVELD